MLHLFETLCLYHTYITLFDFNISYKITHSWHGEKTLLEKCLLCKHNYCNLDSQSAHKIEANMETAHARSQETETRNLFVR